MINIGIKQTQEKVSDLDYVVIGSGSDKTSINMNHAVGTSTWKKDMMERCERVLFDEEEARQAMELIQAKRQSLYFDGVHPNALDFHESYQAILYPDMPQ
ncbi:hypothetical protein [Moritella sp.]|uniref:hypothetical protein n=1 Tax=Moritella sp. TaxID=78556 RepID=UPI001D2D1815|nr:hypothetical protein [Moritella sp.]MCJ8349004.1 hypothetical protein [Moritella sp.]NQZ41379.1 hypothetical protein [Moritella sp.]